MNLSVSLTLASSPNKGALGRPGKSEYFACGSKGFRPLLFRVDFYKMKVICNYV